MQRIKKKHSQNNFRIYSIIEMKDLQNHFPSDRKYRFNTKQKCCQQQEKKNNLNTSFTCLSEDNYRLFMCKRSQLVIWNSIQSHFNEQPEK